MPIPVRAPPSDAVQRARDAADVLIELEHRRDIDHRDLQELRDLLCRPHFKVGFTVQYLLKFRNLNSRNAIYNTFVYHIICCMYTFGYILFIRTALPC